MYAGVNMNLWTLIQLTVTILKIYTGILKTFYRHNPVRSKVITTSVGRFNAKDL